VDQRIDGAIAAAAQPLRAGAAGDFNIQRLLSTSVPAAVQPVAAIAVIAITLEVFALEQGPDIGGADFFACGIGDRLNRGAELDLQAARQHQAIVAFE
jgi:hypothetical protein